MRSKDDIMEEVFEDHLEGIETNFSDVSEMVLLEVMLDMRDLLVEIRNKDNCATKPYI